MYVAAPVKQGDAVIGVLTVAKPVSTVQAFIDRAERKMLVSGLWLLGLSAVVGVVVTLWVVFSIRRLRHYANATEAGKKLPLPRIAGELGDLARAMQAMRHRVEGRDYIEGYVRALTHELKSPLAAIRGAGELLQEPLPEADRQLFAADVLVQTRRLQSLVDRLLALSKLEQRQELVQPETVSLGQYLESFVALALVERAQAAIEFIATSGASVVRIEPGLLALALGNLLDNAVAFAPQGSPITLQARGSTIVVQDYGPGVPDYALPKLGQKFFSTVRPDGVTKGSGLGLAIVQQIMALHGGSMHLENTHPGLRLELRFP
jgi:two-component system sensor histidine kinase CreC